MKWVEPHLMGGNICLQQSMFLLEILYTGQVLHKHINPSVSQIKYARNVYVLYTLYCISIYHWLHGIYIYC